MDGSVGEARFDFIACLQSRGIFHGTAIVERDAIATLQQQLGVESLQLLLHQLQTMVLSQQSALQEHRDALAHRINLSLLTRLNDGEKAGDSLGDDGELRMEHGEFLLRVAGDELL